MHVHSHARTGNAQSTGNDIGQYVLPHPPCDNHYHGREMRHRGSKNTVLDVLAVHKSSGEQLMSLSALFTYLPLISFFNLSPS